VRRHPRLDAAFSGLDPVDLRQQQNQLTMRGLLTTADLPRRPQQLRASLTIQRFKTPRETEDRRNEVISCVLNARRA
jgi:hypothetical protein